MDGETARQPPILKRKGLNLKWPEFGCEDLTVRTASSHWCAGIFEAFGMISVEWRCRKQHFQQLRIALRGMMLKLLGWYSSLCPSFPSLFWQPLLPLFSYWNLLQSDWLLAASQIGRVSSYFCASAHVVPSSWNAPPTPSCAHAVQNAG